MTADEERDSLTRLLNRRGLVDAIARELAAQRRRGDAVSIVLLDIDEFKQVNAHYGHLTADGILARLGERLDATVRSADLAGRLGGDEFVVVLPEATYADAERVAALFERQLATRPLHEGLALTVSWGAAEAAPEDVVEELFRRAEEDLVRRRR